MKKGTGDRGQGMVKGPEKKPVRSRLLTVPCPLSPVPLVFFLLFLFGSPLAAAADYPPVLRDAPLSFPADEGSHPEFRIEWWYVTGWLKDGAGVERGFQVTFFRNRPGLDEGNPSRFAAHQLLIAHAAISDPAKGRLLHDERVARAGFGLAAANAGKADVVLEDWSLTQIGSRYRVVVAAQDFDLALELEATQPPLLQGEGGFSQKGPDPTSASHYYSLPHLAVSGEVTVAGAQVQVQGSAWFDHEWSSTLLDNEAAGWDWMGINLDDGGALMAFRMRNAQGQQHWAGGTLREAGGWRLEAGARRAGGWRLEAGARQEAPTLSPTLAPAPSPQPTAYSPDQIEWLPGRRWRSPRTGIEYPVEWRVRVDNRWFAIRPLFDDQESDSRRSTGTIYWEGAVELIDAAGVVVGRGYLELTGYGDRLRL